METIVISYIPNGFIFMTIFFVINATPLNKLTYMRKCPRGTRKVLLPPPLPLFQGLPGRVAQSVTCLATDACLTAAPGVASSIPARYHTFVEIDHEIISTVILLPSADLFKKGCCQLQAKVCAQITG